MGVLGWEAMYEYLGSGIGAGRRLVLSAKVSFGVNGTVSCVIFM
jgi:hypothetical protein